MDANAGLTRRVIDEIWNESDLALADAWFAPDYVNHGGLIPDLVGGPEAIKVAVAFYRAAFPDLRIVVLDLLAVGPTIALHWEATAARRNGASGNALRGMTFARLRDGKFVESWTCWERRPEDGANASAPGHGRGGARGPGWEPGRRPGEGREDEPPPL